MTSTFKRVTRIIMLLVLVSLFTAVLPTTPAGLVDVYNCYSVIKIDYDEEAAHVPLIPIDMIMNIPITLNYHVDGYFDGDIPAFYANVRHLNNFIYLYIENKPDWCNATISPNFIQMPALANGTTENVTLTIKIDDSAHAFDLGKIELKVRVTDMGVIKGGTFYNDITFSPGYFPLLKLTIPGERVELIEPLESTKFDIEIENLGNAKTLVTSKILDVPEGWTVAIDPETVIGTSTMGDNSKKTISLSLQPSIEFGYHNDREVIQVSITPSYYDDPSLTGQEYLVSFLIQSKGFSTPGFEAVLALSALIIVVICAKKRKKMQEKINSKNKGGDHS